MQGHRSGIRSGGASYSISPRRPLRLDKREPSAAAARNAQYSAMTGPRQQRFEVVSRRVAHGGPRGTADSDRSIETLLDRVNRMKARWLKRVMYESTATSTQKCFAYAVADHLNCVTLDCWPGQDRLVELLGCQNVKTAQRAARGLEGLGVLLVRGGGRTGYRYAPVFLPGDEDKVVNTARHRRPEDADMNVHESLLPIHPKRSASRGLSEGSDGEYSPAYNRHQRGAIELQLIAKLGQNGMALLGRLAAHDDAIVDRLCRAHAEGRLAERELAAARLAAEQMR